MLKDERLIKICEILQKEKFVTVEKLSEILYFSRPTIRRDLAILEKDGRITRSHGGAIIKSEGEADVPIGFRRGKKHAEKLNMCREAVKLIKENNVIFIDGSTTAQGIAGLLSENMNLTVVTNSMSVCDILSKKNIRTYCTGGRLIPESGAFAGFSAEEFIRGFNADIMFFSSSALSLDGVISDYSEAENSLRRVMLKSSRVKVFMCDETKFGKTSAFVLSDTDKVDFIITDADLPEDFPCAGDKVTVVRQS
ncbi:MAG: DeoR/GlpR transcriptional regulator [Clostridia bacterium]|nr:DeoR/GlpR transcriptional regulator [Clostridia bacterium]